MRIKDKLIIFIVPIFGIVFLGCSQNKEGRKNNLNLKLSIDSNFGNKKLKAFFIEFEKSELIKSQEMLMAKMIKISEEQLIKSKNELLNLNYILKKDDKQIFKNFEILYKRKYSNEQGKVKEIKSVYKQYLNFLKEQKDDVKDEIKTIEKELKY